MHLDLGIGGAERLVVNLALALEHKHECKLLTTHHSQNHCFDETKYDGSLGKKVFVYGDCLPRQIFGRATAFCSILRMLYLAVIVSFMYWTGSFDVVVLDGVSAPLPIFKLLGVPTLFYCHYPDKLLCVERNGLLKRFYRVLIDCLEDVSMCCSDKVVCNSEFTARTTESSFPLLAKMNETLSVLYPPIDDIVLPDASKVKTNNNDELSYIPKDNIYVFVSLNRYERKRDIGLAIRAMRVLDKTIEGVKKQKVALVIAGGYDTSVRENVEYLEELKLLSRDENIEACVYFRTSISNNERLALLYRAVALLYTPKNEHFGIVPLEAMQLETPVIAANSGGPLETVIHGKTGYLAEPTAEKFAACMLKMIENGTSSKMGKMGRKHVQETFLLQACGSKLEQLLKESIAIAKHQRTLIFIIEIAMAIPVIMSLQLYVMST
jgi:alpha-1,3/alpha-1,6-mannosyltransferase